MTKRQRIMLLLRICRVNLSLSWWKLWKADITPIGAIADAWRMSDPKGEVAKWVAMNLALEEGLPIKLIYKNSKGVSYDGKI